MGNSNMEDGMKIDDKVSDQKRQAVADQRLAAVLSLSDSERDEAIKAALRGYTSACLTLEDIDGIDALPEARLAHVEQCDFCRELRNALLRPTPEEARGTVLDLALRAGSYAKEHPGRVAAGVAGLAVAAVGVGVIARAVRD
jgi:hypothetical protein